ncbi:MAG: hypothetical protein NC236_01000 [Mycoplasma sp.]|nr:hypothetical protein [Mycoplasma sp.]
MDAYFRDQMDQDNIPSRIVIIPLPIEYQEDAEHHRVNINEGINIVVETRSSLVHGYLIDTERVVSVEKDYVKRQLRILPY